jgi:hypothetical protein
MPSLTTRRRRRVDGVLMLLSGVAVLILWRFVWHSGELERPESSEFSSRGLRSTGGAHSLAVGIGDAPGDTRVTFSFTPWFEDGTATLQITLGESEAKKARPVDFRIEIDGSLAGPTCIPTSGSGQQTAHTCWEGEGSTVKEQGTNDPSTVLSGTFPSNGYTVIQTSPPLAEARNGPYRSLYGEIKTVEATNLEYPPNGVEVSVVSDIASGVRYESFFPAPPHRLFPSGLAWQLPAPGSTIGIQITDAEREQLLRDRSEGAALLIGLFLGLFVQLGLDFVRPPKSDPQVASTAAPSQDELPFP